MQKINDAQRVLQQEVGNPTPVTQQTTCNVAYLGENSANRETANVLVVLDGDSAGEPLWKVSCNDLSQMGIAFQT